ncbi:MAG TPA: hypothetical protein VL283_00720 [Candidatus Baltobacteraceae bacterium]|nr:hypothetical protein [Candidatus Baltobacteraceae bacterium]
MDRINRLESAKKHVEDRKDPVEQAKRAAVAADRNARRGDLMELAKRIFEWRAVVGKSPDGERLWRHIGAGTRVLIFQEWFWKGLPVLANNKPLAHTRIFLDGPHHHFLVEEWCRIGEAEEPVRRREVCRLSSQIEMVDHLHPLMIELLEMHLSGSEAWQSIVDELDHQLDQYVNAG